MTWLRRVRPALFVLGAALAVGSLLGARALSHSNDQPKSANPATEVKARGPIVMGTVDSEQSPVPYLLPPVLQSGTVSRVFVRGGQEVKIGDPLYEFDTAIQNADLDSAKAAVAMAMAKVEVALEGVKEHRRRTELAKQAVMFALEKEDLTNRTFKQTKSNLEKFWKATQKTDNKPYTDAEIAKKLDDDDRLLKALADHVVAFREWKQKETELAAIEASDPHVYVREAEAGVKQAKEVQQKAQIAIDLCTLRAKTAGTIERVTIGPGSTLGVGTREWAMWLIPSGQRIVRAEIEAEFAHRVGKNLEGKEVVIFDNTDPRLTYRGKVRTISGTFLPKRGPSESLLTGSTSVLEAVIEIDDAAPADKDKPPLRVGQRVRVGMGQ